MIERYELYRYDAIVLSGGKSVEKSPNKPTTPTTASGTMATYVVQKGDTLYSIARRHNISVDTLKKYNGLKSNDIQIGQELYLYSP